mgnify:CR=1 FL=1
MPVASIFSAVAEDLHKVEQALLSVAEVEHAPISALLRHVLQTEGKRIRPALVLLSGKLGDYDLERLVPLATAVELLHTATLVHDDVIDNSHTRRGVPTLNALVSSRATILIGDYLFAQSAVFATKSNNLRVMELFSRTLAKICDGELRNVSSSNDWRKTRAEYYRTIEAKTAALFVAATQSGAILANLPEHEIQAISTYGYNVGVAFQIVDDILDFIGDEREMGKPVGSDLRQGTVTLPAMYLIESFPNDGVLAGLFDDSVDDAERERRVRRIVEMVVSSQAIELAREEALSFVREAKDALSALSDNAHRRSLLELADYIVERTY